MKYNETGHARNVANFGELITIVKSIGTSYNPVAEGIKTVNLDALKDKLNLALQAVNEKNGVYKDKIYARQNAYEKMSSLGMRAVNMATALGLESKIIAQAKAILNKIRGGGKKKKKEATENNEAPAKTVSVSQMSFDQRKSNFNVLLELLAAQPNYQPNEEDVKINNLKTYSESLLSLNEDADVAEQELIIARQQRDDLLYATDTGAVDLTQQVKAYIKAAFGNKSNEYTRVKSIKLTRSKTL